MLELILYLISKICHMIVSNGVQGFNSKVTVIAGLILQSLQLQAQLILATLG